MQREEVLDRLGTIHNDKDIMMYYVNYKSILEYPEKDSDMMNEEVMWPLNQRSLFK